MSVYGTGALKAIAAFLDGRPLCFATSFRSASRLWILGRFCLPTPSPLAPVFPFPAHICLPCPRSSVLTQYRNFHLLSIGYASPPRLRPRLTQGRSALPWKPWIFGQEDSHLFLATHSGILSSRPSTVPYGSASPVSGMLLYRSCFRMIPRLRRRVSAPDIFGAGPLDQ